MYFQLGFKNIKSSVDDFLIASLSLSINEESKLNTLFFVLTVESNFLPKQTPLA